MRKSLLLCVFLAGALHGGEIEFRNLSSGAVVVTADAGRFHVPAGAAVSLRVVATNISVALPAGEPLGESFVDEEYGKAIVTCDFDLALSREDVLSDKIMFMRGFVFGATIALFGMGVRMIGNIGRTSPEL